MKITISDYDIKALVLLLRGLSPLLAEVANTLEDAIAQAKHDDPPQDAAATERQDSTEAASQEG